MEMLWRCCGDVVEMLWRCYGDVVDMLWRCYGDVMEMLWRCYGDVERVDVAALTVTRWQLTQAGQPLPLTPLGAPLTRLL